jgi:hypothetical protein
MNVCFIHSCTTDTWGVKKLNHLLAKINDSNLISELDHIFINNVGNKIQLLDLDYSNKVILMNSNNITTEFENSTLRLVYFYSLLHPDCKILYLHTKGISYGPDHGHTIHVERWVDYMLYGLVDNYSFCLNALNEVDVLGLRFSSHTKEAAFLDKDGKEFGIGNWLPDHFAGNYWWTTAKYFSTLPIHDLKGKYDAEFLLFINKPTFFNLSILQQSYHYSHLESVYKIDIDERISIYSNLSLLKSEKIYYGIEGNYVDITDLCKKGDKIYIPAGNNGRTELFGDHIWMTVKHVKFGKLILTHGDEIYF